MPLGSKLTLAPQRAQPPPQVANVVSWLLKTHGQVLATRLTDEDEGAVRKLKETLGGLKQQVQSLGGKVRAG